MKKILFLSIAVVLLIGAFSISALSQGRGRGLGRKSDVFVNGHDARDGRWDARGPRVNRVNRSRIFGSRGARVGYRNRHDMGDYWRHRHVTYINNGWRYRNRNLRNR